RPARGSSRWSAGTTRPKRPRSMPPTPRAWTGSRTTAERARRDRLGGSDLQVAGVALPGGELPLGFVLGNPVALLDLAGELVAVAGHELEVVVGELAPLLLHLCGDLLPVAPDAVPVHEHLLVNRLKVAPRYLHSLASSQV